MEMLPPESTELSTVYDDAWISELIEVYTPVDGVTSDTRLTGDDTSVTNRQEFFDNVRGVFFGFVKNVTPENRKSVFNKFRLHGMIFATVFGTIGLVLLVVGCATMSYAESTKYVYDIEIDDWSIDNVGVFSDEFFYYFAEWFGVQKVTISLANSDKLYDINIFWAVCQILSSLAMLVALVASSVYWRNWEKSRKILLTGFVSQYLLCLLIFVVPISKLVVNVNFDFDCLPWRLLVAYMPGLADFVEHQFEDMSGYVLNATIAYEALKMIGPLTLGLIMGMASGGFIAKSMYPSHFWCGWMIRLVPLTLAPIVALIGVCVIQLLGDFWLASAVATLTLAIVLPLFFGRALTDPHETFEDVKRAYRTVKLIRLAMFVVGGGLLAVWYATTFGADVQPSVSISAILTMVISFVVSKVTGRLVFSDFVVGLVYAEEKNSKQDE